MRCFCFAALQIMRTMNVPFHGVNILADDRIRSGMKEYSQVRADSILHLTPCCIGAGCCMQWYPQTLEQLMQLFRALSATVL